METRFQEDLGLGPEVPFAIASDSAFHILVTYLKLIYVLG